MSASQPLVGQQWAGYKAKIMCDDSASAPTIANISPSKVKYQTNCTIGHIETPNKKLPATYPQITYSLPYPPSQWSERDERVIGENQKLIYYRISVLVFEIIFLINPVAATDWASARSEPAICQIAARHLWIERPATPNWHFQQFRASARNYFTLSSSFDKL